MKGLDDFLGRDRELNLANLPPRERRSFDAGKPKKKSLGLYSIIAQVGFGAGWAFCSMTSDSSRQTMELTFPGVAGLKIDASKPEISHDKLFNDIFAQRSHVLKHKRRW